MDKLDELFKDQKAAGNFATEIYGAKESPFWLSMSYGGDMVRVDPYWLARNRGDLRKYFSYFWGVLLDISGTRLHWGKYLPLPGQKCGTKTFNLAYLKSVYPRMNDWLTKREEMDPDQVFVTDYWRGIFEIPNLQ
jgi:D-arabinono-1,4-lactone oxidase